MDQHILALVSNYNSNAVDRRNPDWLGDHGPRPMIRESGLWNVHHVNEGDYSGGPLDQRTGWLRAQH
jgi:hypothetical protein